MKKKMKMSGSKMPAKMPMPKGSKMNSMMKKCPMECESNDTGKMAQMMKKYDKED